jgi:hypothetical protein
MSRYDEYGLPKLKGIMSMTKVKNAINKTKPNFFVFNLNNIRINGQLRGCSGFITNPENDAIVYINTEKSVMDGNSMLFRYARHEKDYQGLTNRWATTNDFIPSVIAALQKGTPS